MCCWLPLSGLLCIHASQLTCRATSAAQGDDPELERIRQQRVQQLMAQQVCLPAALPPLPSSPDCVPVCRAAAAAGAA